VTAAELTSLRANERYRFYIKKKCDLMKDLCDIEDTPDVARHVAALLINQPADELSKEKRKLVAAY